MEYEIRHWKPGLINPEQLHLNVHCSTDSCFVHAKSGGKFPKILEKMRFLMFLLLFTVMVGLNVLQCREVIDAQLTDADTPPKPGDMTKSGGIRTAGHRGRPCVCSGAKKMQCCRRLKELSVAERIQCKKNGISRLEQCKRFLKNKNHPSTPI